MSLKYLLLTLIIHTHCYIQSFTIMIDPSGDAKHTGRIIEDTFERGITLQCAEQLKLELNKQVPHIRVVLTRVPGETLQPLQNASFANRLQVDFYVSIYFYYEPDIPAHVALYHYLANQTDYWHTYIPFKFYHINESHLINIETTAMMGKKFLQILKNKEINPHFAPRGLFAVPFKPLLGVKAPAIAIEAGLEQTNDFKYLIKPIVSWIKEVTT
ncbi:MAG: hypothetical protein CL947_01810 [Epsilonproteobacteria bacterium]|nr:hypothetical protein [Campylobacterota bacterium]